MSRFNPYTMNGGTTVAIAGENYALAASDTRLCEEDYYLILSREHPHVYDIGPKTALCSVGFNGDVIQLTKTLKHKSQLYSYEHNRPLPLKSLASMLQITLYQHRFFPLYASNILVGLDEHGKGAIYSYDVVGSYEREVYRAGGSSGTLIQSFLDSKVGGKNSSFERKEISKEEAVKLVHDVFISAAERDIHCGDGLVVKVITAEGVEEHRFALRRD